MDFNTPELVGLCIKTLDTALKVSPLQYTVTTGEQNSQVSYDDLKQQDSFTIGKIKTDNLKTAVYSSVKYDLVGQLSQETKLTRRTIADILKGIKFTTFGLFKINPEEFISKAARLINEQKATVIVEHLSYDPLTETHSLDIFTNPPPKISVANTGEKLNRHIYDYIVTDSQVERDFVKALDVSEEVVVYAKLPRGFFIPTPVGDYNPDWAISFKEGKVKHLYFVAETKGSLSSLELRAIEKSKIACADKFFAKISSEQVKYAAIENYGQLMNLVQS